MEGTQSGPQYPVFDIRIEPEDLEAVAEALRSGWLTQGPRTARFEEEFAAQLGCRHVVALASGTAALHLACLAAGVGEDDEVIVPSVTFAATANAVLYCSGTPVFADIVSDRDLNIDPVEVERLIGPRTKAVIVVHYAGYPVAIERIAELCRDRGVTLIEDAAHAPSATVSGRKLGTFGLAGCFSFFTNKVLGCGEGGALATDSDEVAERARLLRSLGMTATSEDRHAGRATSYDVTALGFNYRMDDPRAALLSSRLARMEDEISRRRELMLRYRELLADLPGLFIPWEEGDVASSSCYIAAVMLEDPEPRPSLRKALRDRHGVQTIVYPAVHELEAYARRFPELSLPATERVARSMLAIPLYSHMTASDQERVATALREELEG